MPNIVVAAGIMQGLWSHWCH